MFMIKNRNAIALCLTVIFPVMGAVAQDSHVVPLTELHQAAAAATNSRQANLDKVQQFFATDAAANALRSVGIDGEQVKTAVPMLGDEELARLAARAGQAQADFSAGALSNLHLTYIVIALATAVIILVILKA